MPFRILFNRTIYAYVKNLQGDVVGILDASGNLVVEYKYDAWGAPISIYSASTTIDTLAFDNPFRYRGYVWDEETGLYYLRSRYYNPELGRFLNADTHFRRRSIIGANLFAYCNDNAILYVDNDGYEPEIAPSPSRPIDWDEQFVEYFYFSASSKYYRGKPNSHRTFQLPNGEWRERWYGEDGYPIRDRHWSNHGNSKEHPWVPHDEDWTDNGKGGKSIDPGTARPSPEGVKHPTEEQEDDEEPPKDTIKASDVGGVIVYLIGIGAFIFSLGRIPPTAFAY